MTREVSELSQWFEAGSPSSVLERCLRDEGDTRADQQREPPVTPRAHEADSRFEQVERA